MTPIIPAFPNARKLASHCSFCSMQCGMELHKTEHEPGWNVKPNPNFPVATGRLCQKGYHAMAHAIHPERITRPLERTGPGGSLRAAGWDEALGRIAEQIKRIQAANGPDAVSVYGGGSLTNEVCYLLGKFARVALGTKHIDYNGRYCMSSAAAAQNIAFGVDRGMTFPLTDIAAANFLILAGTNIAECQPTMMPYLLAAKKNGAVVVTIDPRNTMTSKIADADGKGTGAASERRRAHACLYQLMPADKGGREHGQKADQLPGYRLIEDPEARRHVAGVWDVPPDSLPGKGVSAYEMMGKADKGEIKAMIVLGSNPIVSSPNVSFAESALRKLDLLVVIDLFETETAKLAHWLLPGSSFLEAEGTITNVEGRVFYRPHAFEPPGESRLDYRILCDLAERLGKKAFFPYKCAEEVFNELARASAGGKADYAGMNYERIKAEQGLFWPCPSSGHPGTPRLFEERFENPDGKAKLSAVTPGLPADRPDRHYPFLLTTGRLANHYLSGEQTRRTPELMKKAPVPAAVIHPLSAERIGLRIGDRLKLTSRRGSVVLPVKVTSDIHPSAVFVPFHWGGEYSINLLTNDALHPISRMPEFKLCAVKLERAGE